MPQSQTHPHGNALLLPLPQLFRAARARKATVTGAADSNRLSIDQISNMLWAGFGRACHGSGGRAVAGRRGAREVEVYVCLSGGCYRYDACDHALELVSPHDVRAWTASLVSQSASAVTLVYVTGGPNDEDGWEETGHIAGDDVATIAGNVAAYSTAAGLVPRGEQWFPPHLGLLLGLRPRQRIALTQTVTASPTRTH